MHTSIEQFEKDWRHSAEGTLKVFRAMTNETLDQCPADGFWSLGRVAWHLVTTIPEMMNKVGLDVKLIDEKSPMPATVDEIVKGYESVSNELIEQIKANWTDETFQVEDDLWGESWKRGMTTHIVLLHEVHHRGQMTTLMRQAGLKVPGLFGPSKEEWAAHGMEAPE